MQFRKRTLIFGVLYVLAMVCSAALARSPVPKPVLYFNPIATNQKENDKAWRNAGTSGGELEHSNIKPILEEGVIEIAALGFKEAAKWYTAKEPNSTFSNAAQGPKTPVIHLQDWTIGLLIRVNGPQLLEEHHAFGIQATPREQVQKIRLWLAGDDSGDFGNLSVAQGAIGGREDFQKNRTNMSVRRKEWHWAHFVFESGKRLTGYIDGKETANISTSLKFDKKHDMNLHSIFSHSRAEQRRTCNCSIAIYRVYDKALSEAEINRNIRGTYPVVEPAEKLSTTWGKVKSGH